MNTFEIITTNGKNTPAIVAATFDKEGKQITPPTLKVDGCTVKKYSAAAAEGYAVAAEGLTNAMMYFFETSEITGKGANGGKTSDTLKGFYKLEDSKGVKRAASDLIIFRNGGDSGVYAVTRGDMASRLQLVEKINAILAGKGATIEAGKIPAVTVINAPVKADSTGKKPAADSAVRVSSEDM